jgi:hypothetical protein
MTDNAPKTPTAAPGTQAPTTSGLQAKVAELQSQLAFERLEIRSIEGKLTNRDPRLIAQLKVENEALTKRFEQLKSVLFAMILESYQARNADEFKLQYEVLKQAALEYFKTTNTDPELWKSIAS